MRRNTALQTCFVWVLLIVLFSMTGCGEWNDEVNFGDDSIPTVIFTVPANGATAVVTNTKISATFSEAMDPATITTATFTLKRGTTAISGTVSYTGVTAVFKPQSILENNATYTATITRGVRDLSGNAMASDYVWSFMTGSEADTTAPTVTFTIPVNNATAVVTNTKISATFSEAMDPLTITTGTFVVRRGSTVVSGSVTYSGFTAIFTPAVNLAASTTYVTTITTGVTDLAGNAMEYDYVWTFTTGTAPDTTAPTVTFTVPVNNALNVVTNTKVSATFSEAMDPLTITTSTFFLKQGTAIITGTVTYSGFTAIFTPAVNLTEYTNFVATITTSVKDLAGNAMVNNYLWTFATGEAPDTTAPEVTFTVPANNTLNVVTNTRVSATFNEAMDPLTINTTTFHLKLGATFFPGTVTYSGFTAVFTPSVNLPASTNFVAVITTGAKDLAGNAMINDYLWAFATAEVSDVDPPTVTFTVPVNNATNVVLNTQVSATFSEAMDPLTINTATFTLKHGTTSDTGVVTYSGFTAVFTPAISLIAQTTYTARITTGVMDLAGNAMVDYYEWVFTTGAAPDTTAPTVTFTVPVNNATSVVLNTQVSATFSEAMDPLTITTTTFTLKRGGTSVPGVVTYSGFTAVLTPASSLMALTTYTARITTGVRDLAGNAMVNYYEWNFTTGATPDTTAPTVIFTIPVNNATNVVLNTQVSATFSEAMAPLTITTATFTLKRGTTPVTGVVTYSGFTAVLTPVNILMAQTTYTARITTGVRDLAGNAMANYYEWVFTTGDAPDTIAPTVILVKPENLATNVCINTKVSATFSETMDPLTITTGTFLLSGVSGTVSYDAVSDIAVFSPNSDLEPMMTYTATVTTGVRDLAGNAMQNDYVWSFTTGTTTCTPPVDLGSATPFGGFGGAAGMTNQGLLTVINGDIGTTGASTMVTGFRDSVGDIYTVTPLNDGMVNGRIYTAPPPPAGAGVGGTAETFAIAVQALSDANTAYINLSPAVLPGGIDPGAGQLGGLVLPPGIYMAAGGSFQITGSDLTLDGGGDANAVFVFQMATTLTVGAPGAPRSIILVNGASAKNVFWQVGSAATINGAGGGTMVGTIISYASTTFSTAGNMDIVTLNGRALALNASVTMVNTVINVPAP